MAKGHCNHNAVITKIGLSGIVRHFLFVARKGERSYDWQTNGITGFIHIAGTDSAPSTRYDSVDFSNSSISVWVIIVFIVIDFIAKLAIIPRRQSMMPRNIFPKKHISVKTSTFQLLHLVFQTLSLILRLTLALSCNFLMQFLGVETCFPAQ